ncbi:MAG: hypothetical protein AB8G23_22620 [Myxococcota bacterium]
MLPARPTRPAARPALSRNLLAMVLLVGLLAGCGFGGDPEILILTRADDPVSAAIATYYAEARDIADDRILALPISGALGQDEIDRSTFQEEIEAPLESYLAEHDPDQDITVIVTTLGIPLRIGHCPPNQLSYPLDCETAAVDAALAGLGRIPPAGTALADVENPFFLDPRPFSAYRREEPEGALRFLVARLTGNAMPQEEGSPLPSGVKTLIDRGQPEPTKDPTPPLWQIRSRRSRGARTIATAALLDPIQDRLAALGHSVCDACDAATRAPSGIILQSTAGPGETPDLMAPGLVIGLGALEASTRLDRFIAEWTERGAAAFSTHLADPSLAGVTRPTPQLESLAHGSSAIEAHFKSVPHLGWMNVFIGDPLLALTLPPKSEKTPQEVADRDQDGIPDADDNCLLVPNPAQRDSDSDQLGNLCDADVDNNGRVLTSRGLIYPIDQRGDLEAIALTAQNGPYNADHDLDGDGQVDQNDLALAQLWLFRAPGPSGRKATHPND